MYLELQCQYILFYSHTASQCIRTNPRTTSCPQMGAFTSGGPRFSTEGLLLASSVNSTDTCDLYKRERDSTQTYNFLLSFGIIHVLLYQPARYRAMELMYMYIYISEGNVNDSEVVFFRTSAKIILCVYIRQHKYIIYGTV